MVPHQPLLAIAEMTLAAKLYEVKVLVQLLSPKVGSVFNKGMNTSVAVSRNYKHGSSYKAMRVRGLGSINL